ncbi:MAG TPA: hypothetical protein PLO33_16115, partial [Kouleothrix sp.]|nr:hypothetical protein [Kouleothrix sp.]
MIKVYRINTGSCGGCDAEIEAAVAGAATLAWADSPAAADVLLLTGPSAADQQRAATAQAAMKRYGLKLAGSKPFKVSADPRERDLANPLLLTALAQ